MDSKCGRKNNFTGEKSTFVPICQTLLAFECENIIDQ